MFERKELQSLTFLLVKTASTYKVFLTKELEYVFEFYEKPSKEELLNLFKNEKLTPYEKYKFIYPVKNSRYYTVDSFISDGSIVSYTMPDISFYDKKKEIFEYLSKKGNKSKFWEVFNENLKKSGSIKKALEKTYDRLLGIKRKPVRKRTFGRKRKTLPLFV